jgi:hypothetical protein
MADDHNEQGVKNMVNWPPVVTGNFVRWSVSHSAFWIWLLEFWQSYCVTVHQLLDKIFSHQGLQYANLHKCSSTLPACYWSDRHVHILHICFVGPFPSSRDQLQDFQGNWLTWSTNQNLQHSSIQELGNRKYWFISSGNKIIFLGIRL